MSQAPLHRRGFVIRSPQDFWSGLAILAVAAVAWIMVRHLTAIQGFHFGSGTTARIFAVFLAAVSVAVIARGILIEGPVLERLSLRAPFYVTAAVIAFALAARPLGLIVASFAATLIASFASPDVRPREAVLFAAAMTAFAGLVFGLGLRLQIPIWPF